MLARAVGIRGPGSAINSAGGSDLSREYSWRQACTFLLVMYLMWEQGRRAATTVALMAGLLVLLPTGACRQGVPVIDTTPRRPDAPGTISGTVRGPEGTSSIEGRIVEVVNVDTGERQQTTTNNAGGFTFKVAPGRYRVEVTLREGEVIVKQPGTLRVNPSDVDAHADFIVGSARPARPRFAPSTESSLAPPMA